MRASTVAVATLLISALGLGCAPAPQPPTPAPTSPRPATLTPALAKTPESASDAGAQAALSFARQQLAMDLGVSQEAIEVVSVEAVDWPDSGLGCAPPGHHVLTVVTPGYRVVLAHGGRSYEYRSGGPITSLRCEREAAAQAVQGVGPGDVVELEGELVSIGNVPFNRLAISTPGGEVLEVASSALAEEAARLPRQLRRWRVRVIGRGLMAPVQVEILEVPQP